MLVEVMHLLGQLASRETCAGLPGGHGYATEGARTRIVEYAMTRPEWETALE